MELSFGWNRTKPQPIYHFSVGLAFSKLDSRKFSSLGNVFRLRIAFLAFSQCFSGTKKKIQLIWIFSVWKTHNKKCRGREKEAWTGVQRCRSSWIWGPDLLSTTRLLLTLLSLSVVLTRNSALPPRKPFPKESNENQYIAMGNRTASVNITVRRSSGWL